MRRFILLLAGLLGLLAAAPASAQTNYIFCEIKANGSVIPGTAQQLPNTAGLNVDNYIPVLSFGSNVTVAREAGSGMFTGRRIYEPVTLVKMLDKTSPLLLAALAQNQVVEANCKFFRSNVGVLEHFFNIRLRQARLSGIQQSGNGQVNNGMREVVQITFNTITITDVISGFEHEDSFSTQQ